MLRPIWNAPFQPILTSFQWLQSFSIVWFQNPSSFLLAMCRTLWGTIRNCKIKKKKSLSELKDLNMVWLLVNVGRDFCLCLHILAAQKSGISQRWSEFFCAIQTMETGLRWGFWYNEQLEIVELPWSSKPTCAESVVFWFPGGQVYKNK